LHQTATAARCRPRDPERPRHPVRKDPEQGVPQRSPPPSPPPWRWVEGTEERTGSRAGSRWASGEIPTCGGSCALPNPFPGLLLGPISTLHTHWPTRKRPHNPHASGPPFVQTSSPPPNPQKPVDGGRGVVESSRRISFFGRPSPVAPDCKHPPGVCSHGAAVRGHPGPEARLAAEDPVQREGTHVRAPDARRRLRSPIAGGRGGPVRLDSNAACVVYLPFGSVPPEHSAPPPLPPTGPFPFVCPLHVPS